MEYPRGKSANIAFVDFRLIACQSPHICMPALSEPGEASEQVQPFCRLQLSRRQVVADLVGLNKRKPTPVPQSAGDFN
jgi:hypothetical protein